MIKRELERAAGHCDWIIRHMATCAAWALKGKRPEIAAYFEELGKAAYEFQQAILKVRREL